MEFNKKDSELQIMEKLFNCTDACSSANRQAVNPEVTLRFEAREEEVLIGLPGNRTWEFTLGKNMRAFAFKLAGLPVKIDENDAFKTTLPSGLDSAVNEVVSKFKEYCPGLKFNVRVWNPSENFKFETLFANIQEAKNLDMCYKDDSTSRTIHLLKSLKVTEKIEDCSCRPTTTEKTDIPQMMQTPYIYCRSASFLTKDSMCSFKYKVANFCNTNFDENDVLTILRAWNNSPAEQITQLQGFKLESKNRQFRIPSLTSLSAKKYNREDGARYFQGHEFLCCRHGGPLAMGPRRTCDHLLECPDGWDITRLDGLKGTVMDYKGAIIFVVWPSPGKGGSS